MKIIIKKNREKVVIKDHIYGIVQMDYTTEVEEYLRFFKRFKRNHLFGFWGIFQMTKKTNHFYSIYEDYVTFAIFLQLVEYPLHVTSFLKKDLFYPFYYSLNLCKCRMFDHDVNGKLLQDLYKYHLTIRLAVYYNVMTSQQAHEKIIKNLKLRSHNNQIFICHDSPVFEFVISNMTQSINDILFLNKYFIAYNFLTKRILEDSILYGIVTWKEINEVHPDTHYLEKIIDWANVHKKNDVCSLVYFLFVPKFYCAQLKNDEKEETQNVIRWNEPYHLEYKPMRYLVCSFSVDTSEKGILCFSLLKNNHDNYFIFYN